VWIPAATFVVSGERALALVEGGLAWFAAWRKSIIVYPLAALGLLFVADELVQIAASH
jgi:hypothetical protein